MHLSEQAGTYQASVTSTFNATLIGPSDTTIRRSRRHPIASDRQTIRLPPPRRISPVLRKYFTKSGPKASYATLGTKIVDPLQLSECVYAENYALQKLTGVLLPDRVIIYTFLEAGEHKEGEMLQDPKSVDRSVVNSLSSGDKNKEEDEENDEDKEDEDQDDEEHDKDKEKQDKDEGEQNKEDEEEQNEEDKKDGEEDEEQDEEEQEGSNKKIPFRRN
ncbi:nucleolar transcription factor 1-B-like [Belonocnema kinseyi]|uniref:nucleolar transcription factor 1-B-like n=1 Tax=Belonocnema kinseyi TaxID=2817044 RepID=UPI00143CE353|nr:nucleolar transcription factor 1-B-like [Belonocnema kinseyi]